MSVTLVGTEAAEIVSDADDRVDIVVGARQTDYVFQDMRAALQATTLQKVCLKTWRRDSPQYWSMP